MTLEELAAIRVRVDKATPGPWYRVGPPWNSYLPFVVAGDADPHVGRFVCDLDPEPADEPDEPGNEHADAEFIAHSRADVPALIAEIERLRADAAGNPTMSSLLQLADQKAADWQAKAERAEAEIERLKSRLAAAELVCVAYGISPARHDSDREKATYELWSDWQELAQADMTSLSDERIVELARRRDANRAEALRRSAQLMRSEEPS